MKRLFLTLSVLLLVVMFTGTSFFVVVGHSDQLGTPGTKYNADIVQPVQSSIISNDGLAKHTSDLVSGNIYSGNIDKYKNKGSSNITNINLSTNKENINLPMTEAFSNSRDIKLIDTINASYPAGVAVDSLNGNIYVSDIGSNVVSVINGTTNKVIRNISVGSYPTGIAFDSLNGNIYVANLLSGFVSVINGTTNKVSQSIRVGLGSGEVAVDNFNGNIYVTNGANIVSVINGTTNKITKNITTSSSPGEVAVDNFNGNIYVTNGANIVSVINGTTNKITKNISVGSYPTGIAFDGLSENIYVTNVGSNSVSVINGTTNIVTQNITVGYGLFAVAVDNFNGNIYVTNSGSENVSVINGTTNKVIQNISVGLLPYGITFDSLNGNIYVTNVGSNSVSVINGTTNKVIQNITTGLKLGLGLFPSGVAFDNLNKNIYVVNTQTESVSVINSTTNKVTRNIRVGLEPGGVAVDNFNGNIYVANYCSNSVSVINGTTNKVSQSIGVGLGPIAIAFNSTNGNIYVTNEHSNSVSVINGTTNKVTQNITVGSYPTGIAFDDLNGNIYVSSNVVSVINGTTNIVTQNITTSSSPGGVAVDSLNGNIYVTTGGNFVSVINGTTNIVTQNITTSSSPGGVAVDSLNGNIYVTNEHSNSVSVINGTTNIVTQNITVGLEPYAVAVDDLNGNIYVTNSGSENVSVLGYPVNSTYAVTFTEAGLPQGVSWSVALNGTTESGPVSGTTGTIEFTEPNGTYPYTLGTVSGYTSSPSSGTVDVNGSNKQISIQFHIYHINSPRPIWAFDGAYFNYSGMAPTSHGIFPITYFELIDNVNHTTGMLNITQVTSGQGIKGNRSYNNYTDSWNNFFPVGFNSSVLSELNNGTIPVIPDAFTSTANVHVTMGVYVSTPMGTFRTDELTFLTADSNNGSRVNLSLYIDSYSGILLKYAIPYNSTENVTFLLQSTNAPLTATSSILKLNITPSNSMVSVNDIPVALSSGHASLALSPGTYYVSVTASGYNPGFFEVNMTANNVIYLNKTLTPSNNTTYSLSGFVNPSNSSVIIGQYVVSTDTAGYYSITLPSGNYTISVTDSGYYPVTENLTLRGNIMDQNFTLARLPASTSSRSVSSVTATGYNVTISNLLSGNGNISVQYSATTNGTLMVVIPYSDIQNATVNDVMNSRLYINGTPYTNFTVAISSQNGAYNVILTVKNLTGDPTLVWLYSPTATLHTTSSTPSSLPPYVLDLGMIAVVAVVISIAALAVRKKKNK
ncbi:MAG: YVTN family beta-propeller repeat protein [Thermoplasmataceae archaeon]